MKTFNDLVFQPHRFASLKFNAMPNAKQAKMDFGNGYGISVVLSDKDNRDGWDFYSNGIDNYEVAIYKDGKIPWNGVYGWKTAEQVTKIMKQLQRL